MSASIAQRNPVRAELSAPPAVAIVGRPNVGKSALFNRLAGRRISIVHDQPGVTRDRLHALCKLGPRPFQIVDTGGIGGCIGDGFEEQVENEVEIAVEIAALLVFVVDAHEGIVPVDERVAQKLRRAGKPILLAINKVDHPKHEGAVAEFARLGIPDMFSISAAHGRGIGELVEAIVAKLPKGNSSETCLPESADPVGGDAQRPLRIALAGRPNVGKSSLLNAILGAPRAIVSDVPGTTRDAVDTPFEYEGRKFVLVDTAGLRHRRRHNTSVEVFSAMRSVENIERSDVCLLLIDATAGVTAQDKQIAGTIQKAKRPCIVVGSKWDLIKPSRGTKETMGDWIEETRSRLFFLDYAPIILLSSLTGENVPRVFREVRKVESASRRRINTGALNRLLAEAQTANPPPSRGGRRLKILYGTAVETIRKDDVIPLPAFVLFVNEPGLMSATYLKHIERKIRAVEPYPGLPLVFQLRGRQRTSNGGSRNNGNSAPPHPAVGHCRMGKDAGRKSSRPAARTTARTRTSKKRKP